MLTEACGGEAMKKSSVSEWHKRIREGREYMENDERSGLQVLTEPLEETTKSAESGAFRCLSINQTYYVEILKLLREAVCRKRP
jgi:hypothetical protein